MWEDLFIVLLVLIYLCTLCLLYSGPLPRGERMVNSWLKGVYKLTCFTLPECWTGIEKEIVYIQMQATRCLLFLPSCFPITEET